MRALRRSIAWLVLAGFLAGQGAVWVAVHHASLEDDAACADADGPEIIGPHHQLGLQFEETNTPSPIEHCALCHLQRAVSSAHLGRVNATHNAAHLIGQAVEPDSAVAWFVVPGSAPRGPPTLLT